MELAGLTLALPTDTDERFRLQDPIVRAIDRPTQRLVIEVPASAAEGTVLDERAGIEAGSSITVQTAADQTYEGYVEVVAERASGRLYWCGVVF